jgi:SAM-dependent methyltransferase
MEPTTSCPSCRSSALEHFYQLDGIPAHSVLLMPSAEVARGYPRGDLDLAVCRDCGFVFNSSFDPNLNEYSSTYEETQGFSPTFRQFATKLAQDWIDRYDIHDKLILEIGCGKGEFLALMCELGDNRGIGIDPAVAPERLDPQVVERIDFIPELFDETRHAVDADVIVCRHTLEHIAPVADFVRSVRTMIGDRPDTVVLFELPDVLRVLQEVAFWDVYYEHCSYFTPGSLARLFRREGFDVTNLWMDFDDQYILLEARPGAGSGELLPLEDDLDATISAARHYGEAIDAELGRWRTEVESRVEGLGRNVVIWGAGSKGVAFLTTLDVAGIDMAVDINPFKQGKYLPGTGTPVVAPEAIVDHKPGAVIAMNPAYCDEIQAKLDELGVDAELIPA